MEWKSVKRELPICNKKAFDDTEDEDDVNWLESEIVLVIVNQISSNIKHIAFGRIDEHNEWWKEDVYLNDNEEITHWSPLPELPITESNNG
jgi:hypothetical protein